MDLESLIKAIRNRLGLGLLGNDSTWLDRARQSDYRAFVSELQVPSDSPWQQLANDEVPSGLSDLLTLARLSVLHRSLIQVNAWLPASAAELSMIFANTGPEFTGIRQYDGVAPILVVSQFWLSFMWDMGCVRFYAQNDWEASATLSCLTFAHYADTMAATLQDSNETSLTNPFATIPRNDTEDAYRRLVSAKNQTAFLIAHEISHIVLATYRASAAHLGDLFPEAWLADLKKRGVPPDKLTAREEVEADAMACELCLKLEWLHAESERRLAICDFYFFLWCCNWLETIVYNQQNEKDAVRPWFQRFYGFRANVRHRFPWAWESIRTCDKALSDSLGAGAATCNDLYPHRLKRTH